MNEELSQSFEELAIDLKDYFTDSIKDESNKLLEDINNIHKQTSEQRLFFTLFQEAKFPPESFLLYKSNLDGNNELLTEQCKN